MLIVMCFFVFPEHDKHKTTGTARLCMYTTNTHVHKQQLREKQSAKPRLASGRRHEGLHRRSSGSSSDELPAITTLQSNHFFKV